MGGVSRFVLNALLPIPFDGADRMEVDFLDAAARLAIERNEDPHLADADAYGRDGRKDALLQEHRYRILQFLCAGLAGIWTTPPGCDPASGQPKADSRLPVDVRLPQQSRGRVGG